MANQNSKEGSFFLWLIAPLGVALTLLFVNVNGNVAAKRKTLDAAIPTAEMKHNVDVKEHADSTAKKDTLTIEPAVKDVKMQELPAETNPMQDNKH
ncbi:MAG: hypothetical protein FJX90_01330 [Bacteroidetes bacterium]|nr:hypothetical protein [Bacteroidota bacterium]